MIIFFIQWTSICLLMMIRFIFEFTRILQDSLVVCRLRKNAEFRPSDTSNRGSVNERHLSTTHSSGDAVSDGGIDQGGVPSREKAAECSKSYDSCSIEQLSSASESELKLSNDADLAGSSSHQKV